MRQLRTFGFLAFFAVIGCAAAQPSIVVAPDTQDAPAQPALAVVEGFERALADGDRDTALALLAPDLRVFESGHAERSRDEYAASHLDADIAYLKTARSALKSRTVHMSSDSALVLSETEVRSERNGKPTTRAVLETLLLRRTTEGWRITHIHWSSREIGKPQAAANN
jgi:ketosteroid isomerase-like protein